jgi:hypothetical protein
MVGLTYGKQVTRKLLTSLLGAAACFAVTAQPAFSEEGAHGSGATALPPTVEKPALPAGASGMTVYVDPQTGAILKEPAPGGVPLQLSPQEQSALSTSHEGLVEVPVPGGGVKVDLQGRFQSPLIGTIDAHGKLQMEHLGESPESGDHK